MSAQEPLPGTRPAGTRDEREAARAVREMFTRIAPRYDLLNRVLSLTFDRRWRRRAAAAVEPQLTSRQACALDLCCGTADLALELARVGRGRVVGSDFAHPMLVRAREKSAAAQAGLLLVEADALQSPFAGNQFDVVTAAFGFRNLANYRRGLEEIHRLLKPGGVAAILEFAVPQRGVFARLYRFYFHSVLPRIGNTVSGVRGPYSYLPASVEKFPGCEQLARWMEQAGFRAVSYQMWTGGVVALHQGVKG